MTSVSGGESMITKSAILPGVFDQLARGRQREQLGDPAPPSITLLLGQQEAEVGAEGGRGDERVLEADALDQHADDPVLGLDVEAAADRRAPQVGLDQDHALAGGGERGGQVDRRSWSCPRTARSRSRGCSGTRAPACARRRRGSPAASGRPPTSPARADRGLSGRSVRRERLSFGIRARIGSR